MFEETSQQKIDKVIEMLEEGASKRKISQECHIGYDTINVIMVEAFGEDKSRKKTGAQWENAAVWDIVTWALSGKIPMSLANSYFKH